MEKIGKVGKATVREALYVPVKEGTVLVYKVKSDGVKLFFRDFYVSTFDDTQGEGVWGVGLTPVEALKTAEREWERLNDKYGYDEENPFREALGNLEQMKVGETTGEVTVKEVLDIHVQNGDISVYEIKNDDDNLFFNDVFFATYDNHLPAKSHDDGEAVWGFGNDPLDAIKDAEMNWNRERSNYINPFIEAIEKLKESNNILRNY